MFPANKILTRQNSLSCDLYLKYKRTQFSAIFDNSFQSVNSFNGQSGAIKIQTRCFFFQFLKIQQNNLIEKKFFHKKATILSWNF